MQMDRNSMATAMSSFKLDFDFFISSSARVPVNVYDNLPVVTELPKGSLISCLSSFGSDPEYFVHVGTTDGAVLLYRVTRRQTQNNTDFFEGTMEKKRILAKQKKESIVQLEVLQDAARVVALTSAGVVQVMSATTLEIEETLQTKSKVDRIVTEKMSPLMGVACVQKRSVQIFQMRSGEYRLEKEVTLRDVPECFEWTKGKLFIGYKNKYCFIYVDSDSGDEQEIEGLELTSQPLIKQVGELLLLRVGRHGYFATFTGKKTGKKIDWSSGPTDVGFHKPYALSLQKEQIEIHNCGDEQLVQLVKNTQQIERLSDGALLLGASQSFVFCLHPRSWESQIGQLIKAQRVEEAIKLFKTSIPASSPLELKESIMREIQKAAGIVLFSNLKFSASIDFLKKSDIDVREIISLFPGFLPKGYQYTPRHQLESLESLITETLLKRTRTHSAPADRVRQYELSAQEGVLELLLHVRNTEGECRAKRKTDEWFKRKCLDTGIVKLLVAMGGKGLGDFLKSPIPVLADERDVISYLRDCGDKQALAVFHRTQGDDAEALALWKEMGKRHAKGLVESGESDGVADTVDLLLHCSDKALVFKYATWVLERDADLAAGIFASAERSEAFSPDEVLGYLASARRVGPQVAARYLEFLVYEMGNKEERYHSKLATSYLDILLPLAPTSYSKDQPRPEPGSEPGDLGKYRIQLLKLMEHSTVFNAASLLLRLKDTVLYDEQIFCYTRMGEHEEALRVIFSNLKSHNKATAYCVKFQPTSDTNLFLILLKVYLKRVRNDQLPAKVENLLNAYPQFLRPDEVIPLLPPTISIRQLEKYLEQSLRKGQSQLCMGQVEKRLRAHKLQNEQVVRSKIQGKQLWIESDTKCKVCKGLIGDTIFVWYPNGVVCHMKCKKSDFICPVTGRNFKEDPAYSKVGPE